MNTSISITLPMLGAHTGLEKTIYETILAGIEYGMYSIQFFLGNPQSFTRRSIDNEDVDKCKALLKRFPTDVFSHAPYIINLAGSSETNDCSKIGLCISALEHELDVICRIGGKGVVLHPGVSKNRSKGIEMVAKSISLIRFKEGQQLLLEVMAGQGNSLGTTFEELREIYDQIDEEKKKYVSFCIDTAHIWGKGLYELDTVSEVDRMFHDMDRILGKEKISLIHFNDSGVGCGSCIDRHSLIGEGKIWSSNESKDAMMRLLEIALSRRIPCILETHGTDMKKFYI